jgi:biotin operon repressor
MRQSEIRTMNSADHPGHSQAVRAQLHLREMILAGELPAGARIAELTLVDKLGVSRTPIRTALMKLEQEGLLESLANGGYAVPTFTERDASDAIELRGTLEGLAARMAAEFARLNQVFEDKPISPRGWNSLSSYETEQEIQQMTIQPLREKRRQEISRPKRLLKQNYRLLDRDAKVGGVDRNACESKGVLMARLLVNRMATATLVPSEVVMICHNTHPSPLRLASTERKRGKFQLGVTKMGASKSAALS